MPDGKISVEGRLQIPWPMSVEGERYRYRLCYVILQIGVRRLIAGSTAWRPSFCAWHRFVETIAMRRGLAPVSRVWVATVVPDEIGFVLKFAVGMRFPTLRIVSVA